MVRFSKKMTALLIGFLILASAAFPVLYTRGTEPDEELLKNNLISAWQTLASDTKDTNEIIARPGSNWGGVLPVSVTSETTVSGLADVSVLGDKYYNHFPVNGIGWSKQYTFTKDSGASALSEYKVVKVYLCGYNADGNPTSFKVALQVNNSNTTYKDLNGWGYVNVPKVSGGIKFVIDSATNLATLSVGCVMGTRTVSGASLPEGYASMDLSELVLAAQAIDYKGFESSNGFIEALANAMAILDTDALQESILKQDLVAAWKNLVKDTKEIGEIIARPGNGWGGAEPVSVTSETTVSGLADVSVLGDKYYNHFPVNGIGWSKQYTFTKDSGAADLSGYKAVQVYMCGYNADGNPTSFKVALQVNNGNTTYKDLNGWGYVNVPKVSGGIKFVIDSATNLATLSVGCVMGIRAVSGTPLPEDYPLMSLEELVSAAMTIDYKGFASSNGFIEALQNAMAVLDTDKLQESILKKDLISAWQVLAADSKEQTEIIARPADGWGGAKPVSVDAQTTVLGLTDITVLGDTYYDKLPVSSVGWSNKYNFVTDSSAAALTAYKTVKVYMCGYNADGNATKIKIDLQVNNANDSYAEFTGWSYVTVKKASGGIKFVVESATNLAALSVGCVMGIRMIPGAALPDAYESMSLSELVLAARTVDCEGFESGEGFAEALENATAAIDVAVIYGDDLLKAFRALPIDKPDDLSDLAFDDLVAIAGKVDTSKLNAELFAEKLDICKKLLSDRKQDVIQKLSLLGLSLPEGSQDLETEAFVEAVLTLDLALNEGDKTELLESLTSLSSLTQAGLAVQKLKAAWSKIGALPENSPFLKLADWVEQAEQLDISSANNKAKDSFQTALNNAKDLLTKGKADVSDLKELVEKANTMNLLDFTDKSGKAFGATRRKAKSILENKERKTEGDIENAINDLLEAWGSLEVYNRTMWLDFLEYYTGENPEASHNSEPSGIGHIGEKIDALPNGVNTALKVSGQKPDWYPVNHSGVTLENLKPYQYMEFYFKASPESFKGNMLYFQFQASNGVEWYDGRVSIDSSNICGEWCRIELPLENFKKTKSEKEDSMKLSEDDGFKSFRVRVMNEGGSKSQTNEYEISSLVAVSVSKATAGVVPEIAKLVIKERVQEEVMIPGNPFTGVDRGDPWGDEERKRNPYRKTSNESDYGNMKDTVFDWDFDENDTDEITIIDEGMCGDNLTWKLTSDGELTVSGIGEMYDFENETPWEKRLLRIAIVTIEDGVTTIGDGAFFGCKSLTEVTIPDSVTAIGAYAFYDCNALNEITVSGNVSELGDAAVGYYYDEENDCLAKVSPFNLIVAGGSKAHEYAKKYGINYTLSSEEESGNAKNSAKTNEKSNSLSTILLESIAAGVFVIGAGLAVFLLVLKRKKEKN